MRNKAFVEALLYATLITLITSRRLLRAIRERLRDGGVIPDLRWAAIFGKVSNLILLIVAGPRDAARGAARWLEPMLLQEAPDPNRGRRLLRQRVQFGSA